MRTKLATLASIFLISCTAKPMEPEVIVDIPVTNESNVSEKIDALLATNILKIGKNNAPLSLVQFTNYSCDFCKEFHRTHVPNVLKKLIDSDQLQLQIAILPLQKYPESTQSAAALYCAKQQGKGVEMHNLLMDEGLGNDVATILALDVDTYNSCLNAEETTSLLQEQKKIAEDLEISVVPTFFLNGEKFIGLPYESELQGRLEYKLSKLNES